MIRPICLATGVLIAAVILLSGECLTGGENPEDTEVATGTTCPPKTDPEFKLEIW